ncbi:MAG: Set3 complex subunit with deacetylase activity, meiotic-specific repressor of sporulation proteins [Cirrosporium novae-zelandiae]|nr:MAG: Set3 complex subunit with deacetylase activity, meiotic-specific repressor of sporulation proteins [Cirrosporium novae-zelandiae]
MNDADIIASKPPVTRLGSPTAKSISSLVADDSVRPRISPSPPVQAAGNGRKSNNAFGDRNGAEESVKSDSEAETIVSPSKKELSITKTGKAIKDEDETGSNQGQNLRNIMEMDSPSRSDQSRKRRKVNNGITEGIPRGVRSLNRPNSALSTPEPTQTRLLRNERSPSGQPRSLSGSPSPDYATSKGNGDRLYKRKHNGDNVEEDAANRRARRRISPDTDRRKQRRDTRSATHLSARRLSEERSASPTRRVHRRTQSTQIGPAQPSTTRKRRVPSHLPTITRRGTLDKTSDSSSTSGSPQPYPNLRRPMPDDHLSISPAKMPHKKHRDQNGRTLLARACALPDLEGARARLAEHPEDLNVPDNASNTPLQIASLEGCTEIVELLLKAGCEIDTRNIENDTPLIDAVENGHLEVVRLLLEHGANPFQGNAKGEEPLDLVKYKEDDPSDVIQDAHAIREAIAAAKAKLANRRESEDRSIHNSSSRAGSAVSPRDSPAPVPTMSPPPTGFTLRRRTGRSEATPNYLLWTKPTPENLRLFCGKGDLQGVSSVINVLEKADTESFIAAAKGGYDDIIQLLLAIGNGNPDPEPSPAYKPGYNTPMLAAIGRERCEKVIELLLSQPNFDPTRLDDRGMTYYDIAKDRQGINWEREYDMLKKAYDKFAREHGKGSKSELQSPRKQRSKEKDKHAVENEVRRGSTSPGAKTRKRTADQHVSAHDTITVSKAKRPTDNLKVPKTTREGSEPVSGASSDMDASRPSLKVRQVDSHIYSEGEHTRRRRLISGKDLKDEQERKRLANVPKASSPSVEAKPRLGRETPKSDSVEPRPKKQVRVMRTGGKPKTDLAVKRPRSSGSDSSTGKHSLSDSASVKRRRLQSDEGIDSEPGKATTVRKVPPNGTKRKESTVSEIKKEARDVSEKHDRTDRLSKPIQKDAVEERLRKEAKAKAEQERIENVAREQAQREAEEKAKAKYEQERLEREEREKAEALARQAREEEEARQEIQRKAEEAERLARIAREEEEKARIAREEEQARMEKRRKEEEMQRRRVEQERLRREELEKRRAEQEAIERRRILLKRQEEERRRQIAALPNGLRRNAEMSSEEAHQPEWVNRWLPFYHVVTKDIQPNCAEDVANEIWIANFQVCPVLGLKDLTLSQYTAWEKRPINDHHRKRIFSVTRRMLAETGIPRDPSTLADDQERWKISNFETPDKFNKLEHVFWIRLSDFEDIISRYPHLMSPCIRIRTKPFYLPNPETKPPQTEHLPNSSTEHLTNGNGILTNGVSEATGY